MTQPLPTQEQEQATLLALEYVKDRKRATFGTTLHSYWWIVEEGLESLLTGDWEPDDLAPFACYKSLEDSPVSAQFREAWGVDIGRASGLITSLSTDIINAIQEPRDK